VADNGQLQQGLARDINFIGRIGYAMGKNALLVKAEPLATPGHAKRVVYATVVLSNPILSAASAAMSLVGTALLTAATTSVSGGGDPVYTSNITDANLLQAVQDNWNIWAGV
jgi:hypothetical protein